MTTARYKLNSIIARQGARRQDAEQERDPSFLSPPFLPRRIGGAKKEGTTPNSPILLGQVRRHEESLLA